MKEPDPTKVVIQVSVEKPETIVFLPKPIWQMSFLELNNWYNEQMVDKPELDDDTFWQRRKNIVKVLFRELPVGGRFRDRITQEDWSGLQRGDLQLVHLEAVEEAVKTGQNIPREILVNYPELQKQVKGEKIAKEKLPEIKQNIIDTILSNFDNIDLQSRRNFESIKSFFESKLSGIEVTQDGSSVEFADKDTGLIYVTLYLNATVNKKYRDSFILQKGENAPIRKVIKLAVVVRDEEEIITVVKGETVQ